MAITISPPKIRRRVPGAQVLRRMYADAQKLSGTARTEAFNRLSDVAGVSTKMLMALPPKEAYKLFREISGAGDPSVPQTSTQTAVAQSIPQKMGAGTSMASVQHAMKTPAVNVEKAVIPTKEGGRDTGVLGIDRASNLDALRVAYGDKAAQAILDRMSNRLEAGSGGEIMQTDLLQPVLVIADPTMAAQGTSNESTSTITLNPELLGIKLQQGPAKQAEAQTATQEEFVHNTAGTVGPNLITPFWKQAQEKGFVRPSPTNPYAWEQVGVARYGNREYDKNAEEARAKLVTVARRMGVHPDTMKGGFDEWLKHAEKNARNAVGDSALLNHVLGPMLQRDSRGQYTPEAKRAQEWGRLVFQNWAANPADAGVETPSVRVSDNQYFIDGLT